MHDGLYCSRRTADGHKAGQIDAGVVLYLMNEKKMSVKMVEHFLYHDCGLLGLSGISNDVRELLASPSPQAKLALDYFVYRIVVFTGMLAAAMNGIDGLVFTAGIGENAPAIREAVVKRLSWLGLNLASEANAKGELKISAKLFAGCLLRHPNRRGADDRKSHAVCPARTGLDSG